MEKTAHALHIEQQVGVLQQREQRATRRVQDIKTAIRVLKGYEQYLLTQHPEETTEHLHLSREDLAVWLTLWEFDVEDTRLRIQLLLKEEPTSRWHL